MCLLNLIHCVDQNVKASLQVNGLMCVRVRLRAYKHSNLMYLRLEVFRYNSRYAINVFLCRVNSAAECWLTLTLSGWILRRLANRASTSYQFLMASGLAHKALLLFFFVGGRAGGGESDYEWLRHSDGMVCIKKTLIKF